MAKNKWLIYYSGNFNTVEINNSFYKIPDEKSVKNWYATTPGDFVFSIKGYRFLTHQKKLNTDSIFIQTLTDFERMISHFKEKTGPVLWQFPGNFNADLKKLDKFCSVLSSSFNHVFEFRNKTWFTEDVYDILQRYNFDLCIVSGPSTVPSVIRSFSSLAYIRFHGEGAWYNDNYSTDSLIEWKNKLLSVNPGYLYAYFNNDIHGYAVNNAKFLASQFELM